MNLLSKHVFLGLLFGVSTGLFLFYAVCVRTYAVLYRTLKGGVFYEGASLSHESC